MGFLRAIFMFISAALAIFILAFLALMIRIFSGKSIKNLKYPPVYGTVFNQVLYFNRLYDYQTEVARNCPTYRLLSPHGSQVYTTDVRNIEHILKSSFQKYSKGTHNQEIMKDLFGQGIFAVDGEKWRHQRKLASFEMSTRVLRDFSCAVFRRNAAQLVRAVYEFSVNETAFDVQDLLMRCTLDAMFKVGFGVELNCLKGSSKRGNAFIKAFDDSNELVYWRHVDPIWKLKRFLNMGSEAVLKKSIKNIDAFVHDLIRNKNIQLANQEDSNYKNDKKDILSRFLVESKKDPERMNDKYLRDIILNFMIAGKDTSANTLSWFLYMLCTNPQVQEKVAQEVRNITCGQGHGATLDNFSSNITNEILEKMHYLHAALTETLRLYPAVPINGMCAESDDNLPDGFELRKGDGVYYASYAMGRMPYIWGDDAEEFRPERWLKSGIFEADSPYKFIAFHAGPRICLGKDFAYRQMKILAMALIHFFRFKLADETKKVTYRTMFTLHIKGGLPICAIPRRNLTSD